MRRIGPTPGLLAMVMIAWCGFPDRAAGHVELRPKKAPGGETTTFRLEVENERQDAGTHRVAILVPAAVTVGSRESSAGWRLRVRGRRLTLVAPEGRELEADAARSFPISMELPDRPKGRLVFKVLQEYDDGEIVRWIGPPGSEEPAPRVALDAPATLEPRPDPAEDAARAARSSADNAPDDGGNRWAALVIVAGGSGLVTGMLIAYRRRKRAG